MEGRPGSVPYWEAYDGARADLVAEFREEIERRAFELQSLGFSNDGTEARARAEAEILRAALSGSNM